MVRPEPTKRNPEFLPNMVTSIAYDALSENPNYPDGKTLQSSLPGTIPRGYTPLHYAATPEDAIRAGNELINPFTATDRKHFERGTVVFTTFCVPCHGGKGSGDGLITKYGYPPPPTLLAERALKMKDGQMFHILTYGQNNMPSYASQISQQDRWNVILYVRSIQLKTTATEAAAK